MHTEDNFLQRRAELSAAKQALLDKRLLSESMPDAKLDAIPRRPPGMVSSLSFAQQRLWFLQQLEPESTVYNEAMAIRLKGLLNVEAITQAAQEIIRRHEVLRSTFPMVDGQVIQVVHPSLDLHVPFVDLRGVPLAEREAVAQRRIAEEVQRPFYLAEEVPWRRLLLRLDEEEHIAVTILHHIVTDAWSMEVFVRELTTLYAAFCAGQPSPLPELPLQYADYANWQRQWLEKGGLDEQLVYWKQRLGGTLPILELPTNRPRPTVQTYRRQRHLLMVPKPLSQKLLALSRQEGVTLFMTLLAAFNVLLYRYSLQEDLLVGSPIANRTRAELEGLLGCFVNTLVLRTDLSGNPTFRDLLKRVREGTLEAYDHQDVPFEKLVEELQPARSLSHSPLFQVMFVLQNVPLAAQDLAGLAVSRVEVERGTAKFDLSLCLQETAQGLSGFVEYNSDLFDAPTIERMIGHFERLLQSVVADPGRRIANLVLLSDAELEQVLVNWNATRMVYPEKQCLHELVEAQAARTPDAVAVIFEQEQLTYRELNQRANQLAHYLGTLGVKPEFLVGICMERSLELVVGLLGILKAGGAYVPFDPTYPQEHLGFLLQDAQVSILLTQERLRTRFPEHSAEVICVDADWQRIAEEPVDNPSSGTMLNNLAYMIYTSGSTGKPKGAMNTHRGICNRLLWMQEAYQLQETDRVLQKTSFSFDVSVWEFFWPLLTGAQLIIARPGGHRDSAYLIELIIERQVTTLHFVPSMLHIFLEEPGVARCRSLRQVICSGEALPFDLQNSFFERLGASLHNLYGPTEASVDVTHWTCKRESSRQVVPIGYPVANTEIYLLDAHLNPVPVGVPGELHIGGIGLGRGYFQRPELTAEKFIPNSFSDEPGARLYKTGDLARYLPKGRTESLGPINNQFKITA